jgi:hypothetical protein
MSRRVLVIIALLLASSCEKKEAEAPKETKAPPKVAAPEKSTPAPSASVAAEPTVHAPDAVPFEMPNGATTAKAGQFVLAPSRNAIDEALEIGGDKQTFIYYGAHMKEPGPTSSVIATLSGRVLTIPNLLILPLGEKQNAKPGDVVLTAWASGSGLQRAIVVEGGAPEKPKVRYLDMTLDNPSGWGEKEDSLPEGSFHVLTKPGELGTSLACKDGSRVLRWILVARAGDKLLGLGFAGKMKVLDEKVCDAVPIAPKVKPGDAVRVPVLGAFVAGKVSKVDAKIGRVWVKYQIGGDDRDEAFGFTNVAGAAK